MTPPPMAVRAVHRPRDASRRPARETRARPVESAPAGGRRVAGRPRRRLALESRAVITPSSPRSFLDINVAICYGSKWQQMAAPPSSSLAGEERKTRRSAVRGGRWPKRGWCCHTPHLARFYIVFLLNDRRWTCRMTVPPSATLTCNLISLRLQSHLISPLNGALLAVAAGAALHWRRARLDGGSTVTQLSIQWQSIDWHLLSFTGIRVQTKQSGVG